MPDLIRSAVLRGVPELISELGADPKPLLLQLGFEPGDFEDPDRLVSHLKFIRLLNAAAAATGCPHFGLMLSRTQDVATLGMLGMAMQKCPDLRTAMQTFKRYFYLHSQAASVETSVSDSVFIGEYRTNLSCQNSMKQLFDLSVGHGLNIFRFLCGPEVEPKGIYFTHDMPADVKPYKEVFKTALHFNADFNGLTYDVNIVKLPLRQHDDELHKVLIKHLQKLEQQHPNDIVSQVEQVIRQMLPTGNTSIDLIASCLSKSKRTLQNHLKASGASFQEILDRVRSDIASNYLAESNVSMTYLADMLGYSELSAFSRAFKRWFGIPPRSWKAAA